MSNDVVKVKIFYLFEDITKYIPMLNICFIHFSFKLPSSLQLLKYFLDIFKRK